MIVINDGNHYIDLRWPLWGGGVWETFCVMSVLEDTDYTSTARVWNQLPAPTTATHVKLISWHPLVLIQ